MYMTVPLAPNSGIVLRDAKVNVIATHGHAQLVQWTHDDKRHYWIVGSDHMRTEHVRESRDKIISQLSAMLPLSDALRRIPRVDMRDAYG